MGFGNIEEKDRTTIKGVLPDFNPGQAHPLGSNYADPAAVVAREGYGKEIEKPWRDKLPVYGLFLGRRQFIDMGKSRELAPAA
jgi:hypothetical protein